MGNSKGSCVCENKANRLWKTRPRWPRHETPDGVTTSQGMAGTAHPAKWQRTGSCKTNPISPGVDGPLCGTKPIHPVRQVVGTGYPCEGAHTTCRAKQSQSAGDRQPGGGSRMADSAKQSQFRGHHRGVDRRLRQTKPIRWSIRWQRRAGGAKQSQFTLPGERWAQHPTNVKQSQFKDGWVGTQDRGRRCETKPICTWLPAGDSAPACKTKPICRRRRNGIFGQRSGVVWSHPVRDSGQGRSCISWAYKVGF